MMNRSFGRMWDRIRSFSASARRAGPSAPVLSLAHGNTMSVMRPAYLGGNLLGIALMATACSVGPDFKAPEGPEAPSYFSRELPKRTIGSLTPNGMAQRFVEDIDFPAEWWTLFRSRKLNALVERSLKANPSFEAALAALRLAQENTQVQEGKFFPLVQGGFNATRQRVSTNSLGGSAPVVGTNINGDPITKNPFNVITSQVLVSYTLDVWGQNRRAVESLKAQADYQLFLAEAARLTLASNVTLAAIQEASLGDQIAATRDLIGVNSRMVDMLRKQLDAGYANRIDKTAQEVQLAQTAATLPPLEKQLAQQRDLLTALSGRLSNDEPPETFTLSAFVLPRDLPLSLPSRLVEQRPDVRAAKEQLHAASAQVGVAVANMLPNFNITANGSLSALALGNIADYISPANRAASVALGVTQPLFDGFSLLHQKRAAEANFEQLRAQYRAVVVAAFQNVADTLHALYADANALKAASEYEKAAKTNFDLVQQQFSRGYVNTLLLLNARQAYLQARLTVIQARANRLSDTVALYQALGGGWWNRSGSIEALAQENNNGGSR